MERREEKKEPLCCEEHSRYTYMSANQLRWLIRPLSRSFRVTKSNQTSAIASRAFKGAESIPRGGPRHRWNSREFVLQMRIRSPSRCYYYKYYLLECPYSRLRSRRSTDFHRRIFGTRKDFLSRASPLLLSPFRFLAPWRWQSVPADYPQISLRSRNGVSWTSFSKVYVNKPLIIISPAEKFDHRGRRT